MKNNLQIPRNPTNYKHDKSKEIHTQTYSKNVKNKEKLLKAVRFMF